MIKSSFLLNLRCFFIISKYTYKIWVGSETQKIQSWIRIQIIPDPQHCFHEYTLMAFCTFELNFPVCLSFPVCCFSEPAATGPSFFAPDSTLLIIKNAKIIIHRYCQRCPLVWDVMTIILNLSFPKPNYNFSFTKK